jgi:OmpA family
MILLRCLILFFLLSSHYAVFAGTFNYEANQDIKPVSRSSPNKQFYQPGDDTVVIRFDYKQSALFHAFTFEALDSAISILLLDTSIRLSIDGYAYKDEGTDTICYFLSLNRATFIQTYVIGRGIDSLRITSITAHGRRHKQFTSKDKYGFLINCRAELHLIYPPRPINIDLVDTDEDGIPDSKDKCPDVFGYKDNGGCPDKGAVLIPFAIDESALYSMTYKVLDSVVTVLKENPAFKISISGHAHLAEGAYSLCQKLAAERAEIVKQYLLSRMINPLRILVVKSYGISRPLNPAKNPKEILKNIRAEIVIIEK